MQPEQPRAIKLSIYFVEHDELARISKGAVKKKKKKRIVKTRYFQAKLEKKLELQFLHFNA